MSKRRFLRLGLLVFAFATSTAFAADGRHWGHGVNMNTTNADSTECRDHIHIYSDDLPAVAQSGEVVNLPNQPLSVHASRNGGIHVRTWDKDDVGVQLCRAGAARHQREGARGPCQP